MDHPSDDLAVATRRLEDIEFEESSDPASEPLSRSSSSSSPLSSPALKKARFRLPAAAPRTDTSDTDDKPKPVCPSCLNLSYSLFRPFDSHPPILNSYSHSQNHDHPHNDLPSGPPITLPPLYLLIEYHDLLRTSTPDPNSNSTTPACPYCPLLHKAITLFWDDDPSSYYISKAPVADARSFRRILCLTQQPAAPQNHARGEVDRKEAGPEMIGGAGGTLSLFKALLYDDYPDATFPHALTVRDSTSRIEFYCDGWDLVDLQRTVEEREGKGEAGEPEEEKEGSPPELDSEETPGKKGENETREEVGNTRVAEKQEGLLGEQEELGEPVNVGEGPKEDEEADGERKDNCSQERDAKDYRDGKMEVETPTLQPHPAIGIANHVPYAITLDRVVRLATRWLSICDQSHPKCSPEPHSLPRRLLDLRSGVRLIDTTISPSLFPPSKKPPPYITLSHCWGLPTPSSPPPLTTTTLNLPTHISQIPWPSLPLLFRDVILLVRALGIRYLWIDSLCILQDSEEDWLTESANMSSIYAHATLNVAATAQRDASVGLLRRRFHGQGFRDLKMSISSSSFSSSSSGAAGSTGGAKAGGKEKKGLLAPMDTVEIGTLPVPKDGGEGEREVPVYARIGHERSHETLFGEVEYFRTLKEPILSRAWVFQERLLSRRTLHFGSSEVLWECRSGCFCECGGIETGHVLSVRNLNNNAAARYRAPGATKGGDVESSGLLSPRLPLSRSSTFETGSSLTCGTIPKKVLFANLTSGSPETRDSRLLHDFFLRCVEEYSFLSLTKELDRSFALAGIAKRIHSLLSADDRYLAGLWLHDLPRALLWQPYRHKKVLRAGDNIPTWSWMSRSCYPVGNISGYGRGRGVPTASKCSARYKHITRSGYDFELDDRLEVDLDPEKTWCQYEGGNEFGKLKGGQVTLTAAYRWGVVWTTGTKRSSTEWTGRNNLVVAIQYDNGNGEDDGDGGEGVLIPMAPDCPRQEDPKSVALLEKVLVVLFGGRKLDKETAGLDADGPQFFLALREVEGREDVFERIGFLESEWRIDLFENAEARTITLI